MSDQDEFVIIYHPSCKASQKLLSSIPADNKIVKLVNVLSLGKLPSGLKSVPAGFSDNNIITGKQLFEKVDSLLNGPTCLNIFGASNLAGFIDGSSNYKLSSNFSPLDGANGSDGFSGVPTFDENQAKTIEQLKFERD